MGDNSFVLVPLVAGAALGAGAAAAALLLLPPRGPREPGPPLPARLWAAGAAAWGELRGGGVDDRERGRRETWPAGGGDPPGGPEPGPAPGPTPERRAGSLRASTDSLREPFTIVGAAALEEPGGVAGAVREMQKKYRGEQQQTPPEPATAAAAPPGPAPILTSVQDAEWEQEHLQDDMLAVEEAVDRFSGPLNQYPSMPPSPSASQGAKLALESCSRAAEAIDYRRIRMPSGNLTPEERTAGGALGRLLDLRRKYVYRFDHPQEGIRAWDPKELEKTKKHGKRPIASPMSCDPFRPPDVGPSGHTFCMEDGVVAVYGPDAEATLSLDDPPTRPAYAAPCDAADFFAVLHEVLAVVEDPQANAFAYRRLKLLQEQFRMYQMLNSDKEFLSQRAVPHRDFYNVRKVDTHVHHSACMNQKHLLRFIKKKVRTVGDKKVIVRDGEELTLDGVLESLGLTAYDLNVDLLDMHAHNQKNVVFHRFDKFNAKFHPIGGDSRLREIFLKTDNYIHGEFLAEITNEVFDDLHDCKYQLSELRLSIYGRRRDEWGKLAAWWWDNQCASTQVVWLIQIPRLFQVYRGGGMLENFEQMLENIFLPLFEITEDPESDPKLAAFLQSVVGFDSVDDESLPERRVGKTMPAPREWDSEVNPPYAYYTYYIYANLFSLNKFRESRGMHGFSFRPHAGEAGDLDHLAAAFLSSHGVAHGVNLRKSPVLQYLYYLAQVPIYMSPLSNNCLFLDYHKNPFPDFFERGLNVSISSDDPLLIHLTKEPLVEEYSIAQQVWKLSVADMCEIARNSVLHSGFPKALKEHWTGPYDEASGTFGNAIERSNVPDVRLQFRQEMLEEERDQVILATRGAGRQPRRLGLFTSGAG